MVHIFFLVYFFLSSFTITIAEELDSKNSRIISMYIENKTHVTFERLRELTILKAAKKAQSLGYTHFEFMYSADMPVIGSVERQGNIYRDVYGNAAQTNVPSALFPTPIRENGSVIVKFCNDSETPCRGISAREALKDLHP